MASQPQKASTKPTLEGIKKRHTTHMAEIRENERCAISALHTRRLAVTERRRALTSAAIKVCEARKREARKLHENAMSALHVSPPWNTPAHKAANHAMRTSIEFAEGQLEEETAKIREISKRTNEKIARRELAIGCKTIERVALAEAEFAAAQNNPILGDCNEADDPILFGR
jgi:hypothetical protein